ncbi:hypothetical protein Ddc_24617 [Ditylenchus destructor]|nr:hypothetical protein Ddc_24617 [Ditylenchus destructor]
MQRHINLPDDPPRSRPQHQHAIRQQHRLLDVMRHQQQTRPMRPRQIAHQILQPYPRERIQAENGSSSSSTRGRVYSARAIAARCACPPESCLGSASPARPVPPGQAASSPTPRRAPAPDRNPRSPPPSARETASAPGTPRRSPDPVPAAAARSTGPPR